MSQYYIGRQPVFDADLQQYAYELLFRSGEKNAAGVLDDTHATSSVMVNAFIEIGLENLVGRHFALLNMPYEFLVRPDLIAFPPNQVILEILETVTIDDALLDGVRRLSDYGYTFALDDFVYTPEWEPLIDIAKLIKIDVTQLSREELRDHMQMFKERGKLTLAERVETQDEFDELKNLQFDYYQGYFFAKPRVISGKRLPSNKMGLVQMLAKINEPNVDMDELSELVSSDVSLGVKAMKFVNSPISGLRSPVDTVQQAVVYLGLDNLKSWITLLALARVDDKPGALINLALTRAKFCQYLAALDTTVSQQAAFTVGLFSLLDCMLDSSIEVALEPMNLTPEIKAALLENEGRLGAILEQVRAFERHAQRQASRPTELPAQAANCDLGELHLAAMRWADEAMAIQQAA